MSVLGGLHFHRAERSRKHSRPLAVQDAVAHGCASRITSDGSRLHQELRVQHALAKRALVHGTSQHDLVGALQLRQREGWQPVYEPLKLDWVDGGAGTDRGFSNGPSLAVTRMRGGRSGINRPLAVRRMETEPHTSGH